MASTTLEEKINKIRQKNEEIRRRHEEVEADKQNAAKLNALVKMVPPTDWPERKEPPEFSNPPPPRSNTNHKGKISGREHRGQQQQYHAAGGDGKKTHVFAEGDGPPPDPSYNFLADSEREERTREDSRDNDRFRGRGGPLRGGSRRRGGGREGCSKEYRGSPAGPKDSSRPEYEAWRAERNRIDEARISRQRTAEGNWRREWDNNKINIEEDEAGAIKTPKLDIGDMVRKEHKEFDKWQNDVHDPDSPRFRGGKPYIGRGASRGSHNNRTYQHSNSFEQFHGPISPPPTKPSTSPNGIDDRTVVATDKSIKVIVNHGSTTPKGPVMSVKVSSSSIAGTGRVGPRQKPRVLYSSQSESEVSVHEHEKCSSHKSPDDKTNCVSFNRDIEEQQHRYVPKSPHPQRKGESNPKSPYLPRKEFKYDSQQQKHGEIEPKSPYQRRTEFKDSPKSPHFQRKTDFINREPHAQQKSNNSGNEMFKSHNPQRRNTEKTKHDPQKSSGPRKPDDLSNPKPQRINKRNDKSKKFQHSNSKESREPNTDEKNNTQSNKLKESTRNVTNGNKNSNSTIKTENNGEKEVSEDSMAGETAKDVQNEGNAGQDLNIDSDIVSSSIAVGRLDKNVSDDTKSTDDVESVIAPKADLDKNPEPVIASHYDKKKLIVENTEIQTTAEETIPNLLKSEIVDCYGNVENSEACESPLKNTNDATEEIRIQKNIEKKTSDDTAEIIEDISNLELKHEESLTSAAGLDGSQKLEEKTLDIENESKSEISTQVEKIADVIPQTTDTKSIDDENKVDVVVDETRVQEKSGEHISTDINEEIMSNDTEDKEKSTIGN